LNFKLVCESHLRWGTFLPNFDTLNLWVLELFAMYATAGLEKNLSFLKKVFRFLGFFRFYRFFVQRPNTTVRPESTRERKTSNTWYAVPLITDYSIKKLQASCEK